MVDSKILSKRETKLKSSLTMSILLVLSSLPRDSPLGSLTGKLTELTGNLLYSDRLLITVLSLATEF